MLSLKALSFAFAVPRLAAVWAAGARAAERAGCTVVSFCRSRAQS